MILKGSQRGGGQDLAVHLMKTEDNEHVLVHELRGFASDTLKGAFKESEAISRGTKCRQYLFSLSLNPPEQEHVPVEVFEEAINRIEDRLGLEGQPRAVVFHEKQGRRHAHCVWSRIDAEKMTARQLSFFKNQLQEISRDLYLENGWKMPAGLAKSSERDPTNFTLAEWQQAKRTKADPKQIKAAFQDAWAISDSGKAFEKALSERGYFLARGDRRGCVALDWRGEVYSVARWAGVKTKALDARMGDLDRLRPVDEVREAVQGLMDDKVRGWLDQVRETNTKAHETLRAEKTELVARQRLEREELRQSQEQRRNAETDARADRLPRGFKGLWSRLTGDYRKIKKANELDAAQSLQRDRIEQDELIRRQNDESAELHEQEREQRAKEARDMRELGRAIGARFGLSDEHQHETENEHERGAERGGGRELAPGPF